ncbi:MAG: hypothetical protein M3N95_01955 [Actinomycetota bacterium]|nr:hypothetical protein [Actinomycetota bacterium]
MCPLGGPGSGFGRGAGWVGNEANVDPGAVVARATGIGVQGVAPVGWTPQVTGFGGLDTSRDPDAETGVDPGVGPAVGPGGAVGMVRIPANVPRPGLSASGAGAGWGRSPAEAQNAPPAESAATVVTDSSTSLACIKLRGV